MAVYTIAYKSTCAGGGHYYFDIKKDDTKVKSIILEKYILQATDIDIEKLAVMLIKLAIKTAHPTTMVQAKTAIEGISVTI
jgi:hypothetical protein